VGQEDRSRVQELRSHASTWAAAHTKRDQDGMRIARVRVMRAGGLCAVGNKEHARNSGLCRSASPAAAQPVETAQPLRAQMRRTQDGGVDVRAWLQCELTDPRVQWRTRTAQLKCGCKTKKKCIRRACVWMWVWWGGGQRGYV
jgi:hypothetical protein